MNKKTLMIGSTLCLLLTGCSSANTSIDTNTASSITEEETVSFVEDSYLVFNQGCFSNNGYFYVDATGFHVVDLETMQDNPLGYHQAADIGEDNLVNIGLNWFYDGKVCYTKIEDGGTYIGFYMCDIDGTNETELTRYSLSPYKIIAASSKAILCQDTMYVSFYLLDESSSMNFEVLCAVNMNSGEIREITPLTASYGTTFNLCFGYQNAFYFTSVINIDTGEYSDYYNLYRYDPNEQSLTLVRNDLNYTFNVDTMPVSQYIYYGSENTSQNGEDLKFYEYDLSTNEVHTVYFTYPLNENEHMWFGRMFNDFVEIYVSDADSTYMNTIFYYPQTGGVEYYSQDAAFIPSDQNDTYVLGYTSDTSENYLFSVLTVEDFNNRAFDQAVKVTK